jgi:biopolymer transport protein ExbD
VVLLACLGVTAACEEKKDKLIEKVAGPASASATAVEPPPPNPDKVPQIVVDAQGAYVGGERANLSLADGAKRLRELLGTFRLTGKSVTVVALRNARTPDVATVVSAVGAAGVADVSVRTQDRTKKDFTLKVVPDEKAGKLPDCTVVAMVMKDRSTTSWAIRGQTAIRYSKGMAGPDLSSTVEGVQKQVHGCTSSAIAISGDDVVEWGLTFDLAERLVNADPPLKTSTVVLLKEAPVAGRPVKVGGT